MANKKKVLEQLKDDPLMPLRHTAEHILHTAMQELYPNLKKAMGPPIENGFYFDFDEETRVSQEDFPKIEALMQDIIKQDLRVTRHDYKTEEARKIWANNPYKLSWLDEIAGREEAVTAYSIGEKGDKHYDLDLCAGHHVQSTGKIKAFKLLSVAGAYWKGDE